MLSSSLLLSSDVHIVSHPAVRCFRRNNVDFSSFTMFCVGVVPDNIDVGPELSNELPVASARSVSVSPTTSYPGSFGKLPCKNTAADISKGLLLVMAAWLFFMD